MNLYGMTMHAKINQHRHNCWQCGRFVWAGPTFYICKLCDCTWQEGTMPKTYKVPGFEEIQFIDHALVNIPCP